MWLSLGEGMSDVLLYITGFPGKESAWFHIWVGKVPLRKEWLLTPVFLPGEFHGQKSPEGYSPRGHRVGQD